LYKVCIIGSGNIACGYSDLFSEWPVTHVDAYKKHPKTEVVAISDVDIKKAEDCAKKWNISKFYSDNKEMLANEKPDIVSICTPCETHYDILKEVLEFDFVKGIFCEKPLANNLAKGKEMIDLCKNKNVALVVNHIRRYDKLHNYVKENVKELVGNPQKALFLYSGGIINNGSHLFDLLGYYFGDVEWVQADKEGNNLNVLMKFRNGMFGSIISFKFNKLSIFDLSIIGDEARIDLINKPFWDYDYRYFKKEGSGTMERINVFSKNTSDVIPGKFERDFFINAIDDLIKGIEENKKPISSGEDALKALELVMASIYSSENDGERVTIPFNKDFVLPNVVGEFARWQKN